MGLCLEDVFGSKQLAVSWLLCRLLSLSLHHEVVILIIDALDPLFAILPGSKALA